MGASGVMTLAEWFMAIAQVDIKPAADFYLSDNLIKMIFSGRLLYPPLWKSMNEFAIQLVETNVR